MAGESRLAPAVESHRARAVLHDRQATARMALAGQRPAAEAARKDAVDPRGSIRRGRSSSPSTSETRRARACGWPRPSRPDSGPPITALHAETLEVPPYFTHDQLQEVERHRAEARREAQRYLERFVRAAAPSAVASLVDGPAVEAVLAAAARHDLVILGTHGRRGPSRWWIGSVAERVMRDGRMPSARRAVREQHRLPASSRLFANPVAVAGPSPAARCSAMRSRSPGVSAAGRREGRLVAQRPGMRPECLDA